MGEPTQAKGKDPRAARLDSAFGAPATKQLNVRIPAGLADNLGVVAKLTDETVADLVTEALQLAVTQRLARPEVQQVLEDLLQQSQAAALAPAGS